MTEEEEIFPEELINLNLECIYVGMLVNNPKAISMYYILNEDCFFSDKELFNIYKIVLFRDGEAYAPAIAKQDYSFPKESANTYDLKLELKKTIAQKKYSMEKVYTAIKKLFILKKHYKVAATASIQQKILEIQHYDRYEEMSVEEVESAIEQIGVTNRLSQVVLNDNITDFLLSEDNNLTQGVPFHFKRLSETFKGLRRGETMAFAMPSNSGKSRFIVNIIADIAFVQKKKVLIISNEMSEEKMKLCLITTIINNKEIQEVHKQELRKREAEILGLKFRADKGKNVDVDKDGFIIKKENESNADFSKRLAENSTEFLKTIAATDWLKEQIDNSIYFIHITEHTNDDLRKIILNYYYKEGIEYVFYDTLKTDTENIGNSFELKKTATVLSNIAQKFNIFIGSTLQLLESATLPINLTINDLEGSKTVKEVLDTLCLIKQINNQTYDKYEYSIEEESEEFFDLEVPKESNTRYYACVVDKNRAGAKPKLVFRLNLDYNVWEELGYLRLKQ